MGDIGGRTDQLGGILRWMEGHFKDAGYIWVISAAPDVILGSCVVLLPVVNVRSYKEK